MTQITKKPDLLAVVHAAGFELKQRGRFWWARCPLHQERTPSFCVDPERQCWRCFGCGLSGDVIDFVQKLEGISFMDALRRLGISGKNSLEQTKINPREAQKCELTKAFNRWCASEITGLCNLIRLGNRIDSLAKTPDDLELPSLGEMYLRKELSEYELSVLSGRDIEAKIAVFKGVGDED